MRLILSRHGNTFDPDERVTWVGSKNDKPLVPKGREQAEALAATLIEKKIKIDAVYCGPLKRTREYADIVCKKVGLKPAKIDERLNELDYGAWAGLTNDEVIKKFGEKEFNDWQENSIWPKNSGWTGSLKEKTDEIKSFLSDLNKNHKPNDTILVVTSTGRLRFFLSAAVDSREPKVKTGNICEASYDGKELKILSWSTSPDKL
ncbi:MAG: histidine phosphatase family protein [Pseudomonadota bacterium]